MLRFKSYYSLTKPGMIRGNAIITAAGFLFASHGVINFELFFATIIGISCIIASGCVVNNYLDRDIDAKMKRTENRTMVKKEVSGKNALIFATILGIIGIAILGFFTNFLTLLIALIGAFFYIFLYTPLKHRTGHAALIGSIAGAVPIVVGYSAVTHTFDLAASILFLILVLWQMPHFYAIAIYRQDEYRAAHVPVFPLQRGMKTTKLYIVIYVILFLISALFLTLRGYAGHIYAGIVTILGCAWLIGALFGFKTPNDIRWARKMFLFSLVIIFVIAVLLSANSFLA